MRERRAPGWVRALCSGLASLPWRAWAHTLWVRLASLPYRAWAHAARDRLGSLSRRAWWHLLHDGLAPFPRRPSPRALRDWLASSPRHARYPLLCFSLAAMVGVANRLPLPQVAVRFLVLHPAVVLLWELAATGTLVLALALGAIGLARRDRRSRVLGSLGIAVTVCESVNVVLGIEPWLAFRMVLRFLGSCAWLFIWDVPASLFHVMTDGALAATMALFALYLGGLYLVSRHMALCLWRAERPRRWAAAAAGWMRRRWLQLAPRG